MLRRGGSRSRNACGRAAAGYGESVSVHLVRVGVFFAFGIAVNVVLSGAHGNFWTWSSFAFGVLGGVFATLVYYWPRIQGSLGRFR
jgi:hypothetical protein